VRIVIFSNSDCRRWTITSTCLCRSQSEVVLPRVLLPGPVLRVMLLPVV